MPQILDKSTRLKTRLTPHLPAFSVDYCTHLLCAHPVNLFISKPRATKLGDYRPPRSTPYHRISINNDLNAYQFLVTLLHEIAHLHTYLQHKNTVAPHGAEWKAAFKSILVPVIDHPELPTDVRNAILANLNSPKASSCADPALARVLRNYDAPSDLQLLEELPHNALFAWNEKRIFRKGPKQRSRYRCVDQQNKRVYLINGLAPVKILS